jgi:hypothetical protein
MHTLNSLFLSFIHLLFLDNKWRTIWGIIIFAALTVVFNIFLFSCYMQGQKTARKTKRALANSHVNPEAPNITGSEQMQPQSDQKPSGSSSQGAVEDKKS